TIEFIEYFWKFPFENSVTSIFKINLIIIVSLLCPYRNSSFTCFSDKIKSIFHEVEKHMFNKVFISMKIKIFKSAYIDHAFIPEWVGIFINTGINAITDRAQISFRNGGLFSH